ncbi:Cyclic nucleotide-gated cation channel beta-1 [Chionoecetes opilio]|uniref:Cyclic nucleotide-gated cation channel beta-1 n=1 Tax=Chionoecetes opilio TaxID=41210 RepID=A0A8J4YXK0_CHIOP|nr:Cyclic nucleotide-gated cation channel beta-1 [Chionoecetes opilio]
MSFPMLQVSSLGCEQPLEEGAGEGPSAAHGLPPVGDNTPVARAVYVIGEADKRSRSAGVLGCGRVTPLTQVSPAARHNPDQRPRSSPRLGHRRHARVTPFPTAARGRPENSFPGRQVTGGGASRLPILRYQDFNTSLKSGADASRSPSRTSLPADPSSPLTARSTRTEQPTQWSGKYSVPTISIDPHSSSTSSLSPPHTSINLENSKYVTERIHNLVSAFTQRANRVKALITQPPTPSTELSEGAEDAPSKGKEARPPLHSLDEDASPTKGSEPMLVGLGGRQAWLRRHLHLLTSSLSFPQAFEPQSVYTEQHVFLLYHEECRLYIWWLLVVTISYTYNACVIPLRSVFSHYQTDDNLAWWVTLDCLADLIYILDIVVFKSRIMYLDNGFWINSPSLMRRHYLKTSRFRVRLEWYSRRTFHTFWEFFNRLDSVLSSPHAVRVIRTELYMLFLIHLNTCAYFGFSKYEGIGSNRWVFQGDGNAYIRCFYFATKTATSIGKNPKPDNKEEYVFMTFSWLMGVFVFALLIGQIRDIVVTATRNQNEYRRVMDHTQAYLHRLNLPQVLQERVRLWFTYTWQSQKTLNEMKCLESLPKKMRTDIAISVHIQTLTKVQLFQDCDKALLRDLVLKLQPLLYLPGDFVCKKGEVGKEMYIVQSGQVLVMGGDKVLATLGEGSVFGEISLLALAGGNRRTANVRSRGFSTLFVLSKADLQATIKDYPEAQEILKKKATSSLEVPAAGGSHRDNNVTKMSLSESLPEEEEEEEFVVVETCNETMSPTSSCHSCHTTITLHHSLPPSPIPQPHSPTMSMSTTSYEEVFVSEAVSEKPLMSQNSMKGELEGHVSCERNEADNKYTSKPMSYSAGQTHPPLGSSQQLEEDLILLSPVKEQQTTWRDSKESQQSTKSQQATEYQQGTNQISGSSKECPSMSVQAPGRCMLDVSSFSNPSSVRHNRENGSLGQLSGLTSMRAQQRVTRPHSSTTKSVSQGGEGFSMISDGGSNMMPPHQDNVVKEGQPDNNPKVSGKPKTQPQIHDNSNQHTTSLHQPHHKHPDDAIFTTSSWDQLTHTQSREPQHEAPVTSREVAEVRQCAVGGAANTEDLLIKYGLNHGRSETGFPGYSSALIPAPHPSPTSFSSPSSPRQCPTLSSNSGSSSVQQPSLLSPHPPSPALSPPIAFAPHQIACSAIVHQESASPDTSPFDAQESRL